MDTNLVLNAGFNELVFENRHKNYGAYQIRRRYRRNVLLSALIASGLTLSAFSAYIFSAGKAVAGVPKEGPPHLVEVPLTIDNNEQKKKEEPKPIQPKQQPATPPAKGANPDVTPEVVKEPVKINHPSDTLGNPKGVAGGSGSGPIVDTTSTGCVDCDTIHIAVDPPIKEWVTDPPTFKGDIDQFFGKNIKYPEIAKDQSVQGTVWLSWVVGTDGKVESVEVVKGTNPLLDREALRVAKLMPDWNPGKDNGRLIRFRYRKPIRFVLR